MNYIQVAALTEDLLQKAVKELHEDPNTTAAVIDLLRAQILDNKDIRGCIDDGFLLRFLRARKFKIKEAMELYINYYAMRKHYPDIFEDLTPSSIAHVLNNGIVVLLPRKDLLGRHVILMRVSLWDPDTFPFSDLFKANLIIVEDLLYSQPCCQVNGIVVVIDLSEFSLKQASNLLGAKFARQAAKFLQETTPVRVFMHGTNLESLHKSIPAQILPENCQLGGIGASIPDLNHIDRVNRFGWYFEKIKNFYISDELVASTVATPIRQPLITRKQSTVSIKSKPVCLPRFSNESASFSTSKISYHPGSLGNFSANTQRRSLDFSRVGRKIDGKNNRRISYSSSSSSEEEQPATSFFTRSSTTQFLKRMKSLNIRKSPPMRSSSSSDHESRKPHGVSQSSITINRQNFY